MAGAGAAGAEDGEVVPTSIHAVKNIDARRIPFWASLALPECIAILLILHSRWRKGKMVMRNSSASVMDTDEHPYRSPATIASLRPVTLRPHLSIGLPSKRTLTDVLNNSQNIADEWLDSLTNGEVKHSFCNPNQGLKPPAAVRPVRAANTPHDGTRRVERIATLQFLVQHTPWRFQRHILLQMLCQAHTHVLQMHDSPAATNWMIWP
jgi:hypothetical protein